MKTRDIADAQNVFDVIDTNRAFLREWLPWVDGTKSVTDIESVLQKWNEQLEKGTDVVLGIYFDNTYVGNIGIHDIKKHNNSAMIGYWLAESYQGKGIITDCVRMLVDHCFFDLNLNRVSIHCAFPNQKSRAIPERLGFIQEGILQDAECLHGNYYDLVVYGVLKRNWKLPENVYRNTAWLYDVDNRDNVHDDIPFYIEYAKQQQGEILELACGTGRVALALAADGYLVTGLDLSKQMLDIFRQKLTDKPELAEKLTLVYGSMADFTFDRKFAMIIIPFRAFMCLTDDADIDNSLNCIREHLNDNGIFIVNMFDPIPERMTEEKAIYPEAVQWERLDEKTGNYVVKKVWQNKIDTVNQIIYPQQAYEVTYPDGKFERIEDRLKLKYYFSDQLRAVIEKAGMEITEEYSWYDKTPMPGREIIFVCRRKR
jgi:RimJ/RimL family protein N-acetyltransferase/ubiquinone/menaquinone biosynthesis C-methylase UbiE